MKLVDKGEGLMLQLKRVKSIRLGAVFVTVVFVRPP